MLAPRTEGDGLIVVDQSAVKSGNRLIHDGCESQNRLFTEPNGPHRMMAYWIINQEYFLRIRVG